MFRTTLLNNVREEASKGQWFEAKRAFAEQHVDQTLMFRVRL